MLLCDRNERAYAPIGIEEGVHAAMFNSSDEFVAKVRYYLEREHERRRIIANARRLVLARHQWRQRGEQLVQMVREALAE